MNVITVDAKPYHVGQKCPKCRKGIMKETLAETTFGRNLIERRLINHKLFFDFLLRCELR